MKRILHYLPAKEELVFLRHKLFELLRLPPKLINYYTINYISPKMTYRYRPSWILFEQIQGGSINPWSNYVQILQYQRWHSDNHLVWILHLRDLFDPLLYHSRRFQECILLPHVRQVRQCSPLRVNLPHFFRFDYNPTQEEQYLTFSNKTILQKHAFRIHY